MKQAKQFDKDWKKHPYQQDPHVHSKELGDFYNERSEEDKSIHKAVLKNIKKQEQLALIEEEELWNS
jgi:hypothetical protein